MFDSQNILAAAANSEKSDTSFPENFSIALPFATRVPLYFSSTPGNERNLAYSIGSGNDREVYFEKSIRRIISFICPRDCYIKSIKARFYNEPLFYDGPPTPKTVVAQIYTSKQNEIFFTPIEETKVSLSPSFTEIEELPSLAIGELVGLNIKIAAHTKIALITYIEAPDKGEDDDVYLFGSIGAFVELA